MYVDSQEQFSAAQVLTVTAISTNVIDLNPTGGANATQDIAIGEDMWLVVKTNTTVTDTGSDATLIVTLESDTAVGLGASPVVHINSGTLAFATYATAGTVLIAARIPSGTYKRYLGVRYTIASGPWTAGAVDAFLTKDYQKNVAYATGFAVS